MLDKFWLLCQRLYNLVELGRNTAINWPKSLCVRTTSRFFLVAIAISKRNFQIIIKAFLRTNWLQTQTCVINQAYNLFKKYVTINIKIICMEDSLKASVTICHC